MKLIGSLFAVLALASCGQVSKLGTATAGGFSKVSSGLAKATDATKESFSNLMPSRSRIPVVEVRESDLRKLPTGQEQALAFEKSRRNRFWGMFSGPVDFKEPSLPDDMGPLDTGLLPPLPE